MPGRPRAALAILVCAAAATLLLAQNVGPTAPVPSTSAPASARTTPPDPARFADEIKRFTEWDARNSFPAGAVLFVGSSSIRLWPTHASFPALPVINRGFGGAHVTDVTHYFDRVVAPYRARAIVFYAGDNDIAAGRTPEDVRDDFAAFLARVRAAAPTVPVLFLSIKPSLARWPHWPAMQAANALIRRVAASDPRLEYVDLATPLLGPDRLPAAEYYVADGLHLSDAGYQIWTETLAPVLAKAQSGAHGSEPRP
jgi:lysophospholipase L1-like esterase